MSTFRRLRGGLYAAVLLTCLIWLAVGEPPAWVSLVVALAIGWAAIETFIDLRRGKRQKRLAG